MRNWQKIGSSHDDVEDFLCVEDARLRKREGSAFLEYRVDGFVCDDVDAALEKPIVLTDDERQMLMQCSDKPFDALKKRPHSVVAALYHKGLISIDNSTAIITENGKTIRDAL